LSVRLISLGRLQINQSVGETPQRDSIWSKCNVLPEPRHNAFTRYREHGGKPREFL